MQVTLEPHNIYRYGHAHAFVADSEEEDGYAVTELKRDVQVEEVRGHKYVEKNAILEYDVIFNVDGITTQEREEFIAKVTEKKSDGSEQTTQYPIEEDLVIKHSLEKEQVFPNILIDVVKKAEVKS